MRTLVIVVLAALSGCATAPKTAVMPDGRVAQMAYCDGATSSMAACYNKAAERCGGQYDIVDRSESSALNGYDKSVSSTPMREIAFICKTT